MEDSKPTPAADAEEISIHLRTLAAGQTDAVLLIDHRGRVVLVNQVASWMLAAVGAGAAFDSLDTLPAEIAEFARRASDDPPCPDPDWRPVICRLPGGGMLALDARSLAFPTPRGRLTLLMPRDASRTRLLERCTEAQTIVAEVLENDRPLETLIPTFLQVVQQSLAASAALLWRVDAQEQFLELAGAAGSTGDPGDTSPGRRLAAGTGAAGAAWEAAQHDPRQPAVALQAGPGRASPTVLTVPIRSDRKPWGVLELHAGTREAAAELLRAVRGISLQLALFLERQRAESDLALRANELRQSQKMGEIGMLTGGVAHDFNNILMTSTGYAELAASELPPDHPASEYVRLIQTAGQRGAALTRQLLSFSRKQIVEPRPLQLNACVEHSQRFLRRLIGEDIALETVLCPTLGMVRADPGLIDQVIMNLVVNARDAMPRGGRILIETSNSDVRSGGRRVGDEPGRYVMLRVSDDGTGMPPEVLARVFEPFFTTKEGRGTGLGLSTVYGIVRQCGGHIAVESQPGSGTTFRLHLPRLESSERAPEVVQTVTALPEGGETVLVVEDEEPVRQLVARMLRKRGYRVLEASGSEIALSIARDHPEPIDLLLSDTVMPHISGLDLAVAIRQLRRDVKVIQMSGHINHPALDSFRQSPGTTFIQKPFTAQELLVSVREVLDGTRSSDREPDG